MNTTRNAHVVSVTNRAGIIRTYRRLPAEGNIRGYWAGSGTGSIVSTAFVNRMLREAQAANKFWKVK